MRTTRATRAHLPAKKLFPDSKKSRSGRLRVGANVLLTDLRQLTARRDADEDDDPDDWAVPEEAAEWVR